MEEFDELIRDLYGKYAPNEFNESKIQYVKDNYSNDVDGFVKDFYGKYAPNEYDESKIDYIKKNYNLGTEPVKKKEESDSFAQEQAVESPTSSVPTITLSEEELQEEQPAGVFIDKSQDDSLDGSEVEANQYIDVAKTVSLPQKETRQPQAIDDSKYEEVLSQISVPEEKTQELREVSKQRIQDFKEYGEDGFAKKANRFMGQVASIMSSGGLFRGGYPKSKEEEYSDVIDSYTQAKKTLQKEGVTKEDPEYKSQLDELALDYLSSEKTSNQIAQNARKVLEDLPEEAKNELVNYAGNQWIDKSEGLKNSIAEQELIYKEFEKEYKTYEDNTSEYKLLLERKNELEGVTENEFANMPKEELATIQNQYVNIVQRLEELQGVVSKQSKDLNQKRDLFLDKADKIAEQNKDKLSSGEMLELVKRNYKTFDNLGAKFTQSLLRAGQIPEGLGLSMNDLQRIVIDALPDDSRIKIVGDVINSKVNDVLSERILDKMSDQQRLEDMYAKPFTIDEAQDFSDVMYLGGSAIAENFVSLAAGATGTVAPFLYYSMGASDKRAQIEQQKSSSLGSFNPTPLQMFTSSQIAGVAEGTLGLVGTIRNVRAAKSAFSGSQKAINKYRSFGGYAKHGGKEIFKGGIGEIGEELGIAVVDATNDYFVLGDDESFKRMKDNVGQIAFSSGFVGSATRGAPHTIGMLGRVYGSAKSHIEMRANSKRIKTLSENLMNKDLSDENRKMISDEIIELIYNNDDFLRSDIMKLNNLPAKDRNRIADIYYETNKLRDKVKDLQKDPNVNKETKEQFIGKFKEQAKKLQEEKESILTGVEETNIKPKNETNEENPFASEEDGGLKLKEQASQRLLDKKKESGEEEFTITDEEITEEALKIQEENRRKEQKQNIIYAKRDIGDGKTAILKIEDGQKTVVGESQVPEGTNIIEESEADAQIETAQDKTSEESEKSKYFKELEKAKNSSPEKYWSVSRVKENEEGSVIAVSGGYGFVGMDGDIKGVFKKIGFKSKKVADKILQKAIQVGGNKLDNFDNYLTDIYKRNGFRVVSRTPFNEEFAPEGWNKEKHGTPDVVAMVYDPDGKLNIEEKTFSDPETGYQDMIDYRDSYLNQIEKTPSQTQSDATASTIAQETEPKASKSIKDKIKVYLKDVFGLDKKQSNAGSVIVDKIIKTMANREGISREKMFEKLGFKKGDKKTLQRLSKEGKALFQIVGENSALKEYFRKNLKVAKEMESKDKSEKEIWFATGWQRGADGKWRTEIDDSKMELHRDFMRMRGFKLSDAIKYDELFELYPKLKDVKVFVLPRMGNMMGAYLSEQNIMFLNRDRSKSEVRSTLLHEIQHIIQDMEGFATGGTAEAANSYLRSKIIKIKLAKNIPKALSNAASKLSSSIFQGVNINSSLEEFNSELSRAKRFLSKDSFELYQSISGEVESRNVQTRMGMTNKERRETPISETEDVSREEQVILFQGEKGAFVAEDGKFIVYALTDPNISTPLHEMAHVYEHYLTDTERKEIQKWAETKEWTTETSEKFARGFEKYLAEGKAPTPALQKHFENFKQWLTEIYNGIVGSDIDIELNAPMREIYDAMLTPEQNQQDSDAQETRDQTVKGNYEKAKETFKSSRSQASKSNRSILDNIKKALIKFSEEVFDRQRGIKKMLNSVGMDKVVDFIVTKAGANSLAKFRSEKAYKSTFKGLTNKEIEQLEDIIILRRNISIAENRANRGLDPLDVENTGGLTASQSEKALEGYKSELGNEKYSDLFQRSEAYFDEYKKILREMRDEGLITEETYQMFAEVNYQPREFLDFMENMDGEFLTDQIEIIENMSLNDKQIKGLKGGYKGNQLTDALFILQRSLLTRTRNVFANRVNKTFVEEFQRTKNEVEKLRKKDKLSKKEKKKIKDFENVEKRVKDDKIIDYTERGNPIYESDGKNIRGFKPLFYYTNGVKQKMLLEEKLHDQINDTNNKYINNPSVREALALVSGTSSIKTLATGNNPFFFITNAPRDFLFTLLASREYGNEMLSNGVKLAIDSAKGVRDVIKGNTNYQKYLEYGGGMDWLSLQGKFNKKSFLQKVLDKFMNQKTQRAFARNRFKRFMDKFNLASEVGIRLAVFNRSIKNQLKGRNMSDLKKSEQDAIYTKAARSARELSDFNQGGRTFKTADAFIPYLNAATQGTRAGVEAFNERPLETSIRAMQLTAYTVASTISMSIGLISIMRGGEDEDDDVKKMSNSEIYLKTLEFVSQYDLDNYFIIPTSQKDKEGNWEYYRIAKPQFLTPIINTVEHYIRKALSIFSGGSYKGDLGSIMKNTVEKNILPIELSPTSAVSSIPIVSAAFAMEGIDAYTGNPLSWDRGEIPEQLEGITDDRVEPLFKEIGLATNQSPARLQKATESFITTPSTNPYIAVAYALGNLTTSNETIETTYGNVKEDTKRALTGRMRKYTNPYNEFSKIKESVSGEILEAYKKHMTLEKKVRENVRKYKSEDISEEKLYNNLKELAGDSPDEIKRIISWGKSEAKKRKVLPLINSLKYERNKEARAFIIAEKYGDIFLDTKKLEGEERKVFIKLRKERVIDSEVYNYYKKMMSK